MPNEVIFTPNVPQTLALHSVEGELDDRYNRVHYTTADGRDLSVSSLVAVKINGLELRPGEQFGMCKRWTGNRADPVEWTVWLDLRSEKARAAEEVPEVERQLVEPVREIRRRLAAAVVPDPELSTGTNGRSPLPAKSRSLPPARIPYNVAFKETVQFVTAGLKEVGEQWSDQARQDMVSTIIIAASKAGLLSLWERP